MEVCKPKGYIELPTGEFSKSFLNMLEKIAQQKCMPSGIGTGWHLKMPTHYKQYNPDTGINVISEMLYVTNKHFATQYLRFIKECVYKHFRFPFYFQKTPTIRVQVPDKSAAKHYPRWHNDLIYGHPPGMINFWIPLTEPIKPQNHGFKFCGMDSVVQHVKTPFGSMLAFDSRCIHTTEPMESHTRISMDIRIIAVDDFNKLGKQYVGTGRTKAIFAPAHAYHEKNSEEL